MRGESGEPAGVTALDLHERILAIGVEVEPDRQSRRAPTAFENASDRVVILSTTLGMGDCLTHQFSDDSAAALRLGPASR
jgi:hypothetical protein